MESALEKEVSCLAAKMSSPVKLQVKEDKPTLESQRECAAADAPHVTQLHEDQDNEAEQHDKTEEEEEVKKSANNDQTPEELKEVEEEDDGFRTPPSSSNKIPGAKKCPPAPRKPKPSFSSSKRIVELSVDRRSQRFFLSDEVESMFSSILPPDFNRKIKRARKDGAE